MESLQKYTEAERFYELDEAVLDTLEKLTLKQHTQVILQIDSCIGTLEKKNDLSQIVAGIIPGREPIYYGLRYVNEEEMTPYFFHLFKITLDEYLDLYNLNKIIKS